MATDKMSSESESEEFYDAEDLTPNRATKWVLPDLATFPSDYKRTLILTTLYFYNLIAH